MYTEINRCRLTGSSRLLPVLDLGNQHLTGVFPRTPHEDVVSGPVQLVFCPDGGLLQLKQSYSLDQMYGGNYGYRSGLNQSMVTHLDQIANYLTDFVELASGDTVLDIGSNDGTLLGAYQPNGLTLIGIDPSAEKFRQFYREAAHLVVDFFSAALFNRHFPGRKAKIVTSVAMFYDLEDPVQFARDVASVLAAEGVWHFEQSYMPLMLKRDAYDTVCHEHLEYYALSQIQWITQRAGLKILSIKFNDINGGSFSVTAARQEARYPADAKSVDEIIATEKSQKLDTVDPYLAFRGRVARHRQELTELVHKLNAQGSVVAGLGASTKGNVVLQYCGFTPSDIRFISEVNPDKFGCYTPGTLIPIISDTERATRQPDYMLVLPWHFRENIIEREAEFMSRGGRLIFPLPRIDVVGAEGALT